MTTSTEPESGSSVPFDGHVPTTDEGIEKLRTAGPPGWEYILFAAALRRAIRRLEPKSRDHELEYSPQNGGCLDRAGAITYFQQELSRVQRIVEAVETLFSAKAQESAFGRPGEPGDSDRILHLADRVGSMYEELLDWSAAIRSTTVTDDDLAVAGRALARLTDQPLQEVREFVDSYFDEMEGLTAALNSGQDVNLEMSLSLTMDPDALQEYSHALDDAL